jgi:hypothetical protein
MFGNDTASFRAAMEAKALAEKVSQESSMLAAVLKTHVDDCNRRADRLDRDLEKRDREAKSDLDTWRIGLESRLDKQDRMNMAAMVFIITMLLAVVAELLHSLKLF